MGFPVSLVMIAPAADKAAVETLGLALGHSGDEFTVPLFTPPGASPTHYGLHSWATVAVAALWTGTASVPGISDADLAWLRATLIISASQSVVGKAHFDQVIGDAGLVTELI